MALMLARNRVIVCLLLFVSILPSLSASPVAAQSTAVAPMLTSAMSLAIPQQTISVSGRGFTSGGLVFVALYDGWGVQLLETRWASASVGFYGPGGSQDPAQAYLPGGMIDETFALSRQETFGPNGSQDPAQGYTQGSPVNSIASVDCDDAIMVRAFDRQTATWSNLLDVDTGC